MEDLLNEFGFQITDAIQITLPFDLNENKYLKSALI